MGERLQKTHWKMAAKMATKKKSSETVIFPWRVRGVEMGGCE